MPLTITPPRRAFLIAWILANGWSETVGLGATLLVGRRLAPLAEGAAESWSILAWALLAVGVGTVLEGVLVGFAQGRVIARHTDISVRAWILATSAGAGLAWLVGMMPSTLIGLLADMPADATPVEPSPALRYGLAFGLGAVAGPVLAIAQWVVLRRTVARPTRWLAANAAAWGIGMVVIFAGMDLVPWDAGSARVTLGVLSTCAVAGLAVGAVHGPVLLRLLSPDSPAR